MSQSECRTLAKSRITALACIVLTLFVLIGVCSMVPAQTAEAKTLSATITVKAASTGKVALAEGSSYKLQAKTTAGKLSYKSSNPSVVSVSKKGVLKAGKAGKATITITAKSGKAKKTKKIKVTVLKKTKFKKVKSLQAKLDSSQLAPGAKSKIKVTFKPKKASNKNLMFKSSNNNVAKVAANGTVTAVAPGTAKITVTSCAQRKAKATLTVTVKNPSEAASGTPSQGGDTYVTPTYVVTFDSNGGSSVAMQTVKEDGVAHEPAAPTKDGFEFSGWYTSKSSAYPYDFSDSVYEDMTLYAKWSKTTADYFTLSVDKNAAPIETDDESYYDDDDDYSLDEDEDSDERRQPTFSLETDLLVDEIALFDKNTGEQVATLKDNESYGESDGIAGDGTYTGRVYRDSSEEETVEYCAKYGPYESNGVEVQYYKPFSSEFLDQMAQADDRIVELMDQFAYEYEQEDEEGVVEDGADDDASGSDEDGADDDASGSEAEGNEEPSRADRVKELLGSLENEGLIVEGSIQEHPDSGLYAFEYGEGVTGVVPYKKFDSEFNADLDTGASESGRDARSERRADESGSAPRRMKSANHGDLGDALVLNAFPSFETEDSKISFRTDFYYDLESDWEKKGLDTWVDENVTISDFESLDDYAVVMIATHGSTTWVDSEDGTACRAIPCIVLSQRASTYYDNRYDYELRTDQIQKFGGAYCILPEFFNKHYDEVGLSNTVVCAECCEFLGRYDSWDYAMSDAFESRGVKSLIGFHNSVYAEYSRELMKTYIEAMADGKSSQEAFNAAMEKHGSNHKEWYDKTHIFSYDSSCPIAYPRLFGEKSAKLFFSQIKNGGFEDAGALSFVSPKLKDWLFVGDARSLTKLGDVLPYSTGAQNKRMAIITTGIGSSNTAVLEDGTEGSCIYQKFFVPNDASEITFNYNVISEEPLEYVGSQYNDAFYVQIQKGGEQVRNEMLESINSSSWRYVGGIDFSDGDDTVYQVGWNTKSMDVSAYRGQTITLKFIVYDVGDSAYDTACVIDNVMMK